METLKTMLTLITMIAAFAVIIGWFIDSPVLKSLGEGNVSMKMWTASMFILVPMYLWKRHDILELVIVCSIIYECLHFLYGLPVLNMEIGHEIYTVKPDFPSWMTILCFGLCLIHKKLIGQILIVISFICILGHLSETPLMFFYIEGVSTGMALNTALLFMHMAGIIMINESNGSS